MTGHNMKYEMKTLKAIDNVTTPYGKVTWETTYPSLLFDNYAIDGGQKINRFVTHSLINPWYRSAKMLLEIDKRSKFFYARTDRGYLCESYFHQNYLDDINPWTIIIS